MLYAIILAGGKGERFWPWSRADRPKQLLPIAGEKTLLEETVERVLPVVPKERILLVTGEDLAETLPSRCPQLKDIRIVAEPCGRNTAAAIGLAAITIRSEDPGAVMAVLSADHRIHPQDKFLSALTMASRCAEREKWLVTFGIPPTRPETGYGYIELGEKIICEEGGVVYRAKAFNEKPTRMVAQQFYLDGSHVWNSGMFVWQVETLLEAMRVHMPQLYRGLEELSGQKTADERQKACQELYTGLDAVSIDYGVMEKADNVVVVRGDFRWDDIGTWQALRRIYKRDGEGNVILGPAVAMDSFECILACQGSGVIATLGVSDLIVARTDDCVLVAHVSRAQDVRQLVEKLAENPELKKYL